MSARASDLRRHQLRRRVDRERARQAGQALAGLGREQQRAAVGLVCWHCGAPIVAALGHRCPPAEGTA